MLFLPLLAHCLCQYYAKDWADLPREEKYRYKALETDKWERFTPPYLEVKDAGKNGDTNILKAVMTAYKEESAGNSTQSDPNLSSILGWGLTPWYRKTDQETSAHTRKVFARYLVACLRGAAENGHLAACTFLWVDGPLKEYWEEGDAINWPARVDGTIRGRFASATQNPLYLSANGGHMDIFRVLLGSANGVKNPMLQSFWNACNSEGWHGIQNCRARRSDSCYDMIATEKVQLIEAAIFMLKHGAETENFEVLLFEASKGYPKEHPDNLMKILLEYWMRKYPSGSDGQGETIFHGVCKSPRCSVRLMEFLLKHSPGDSLVTAVSGTEGLLAIHFACIHNLELDSIYLLARQYPHTLSRFRPLLGHPRSPVGCGGDEPSLATAVKKLRTK